MIIQAKKFYFDLATSAILKDCEHEELLHIVREVSPEYLARQIRGIDLEVIQCKFGVAAPMKVDQSMQINGTGNFS